MGRQTSFWEQSRVVEVECWLYNNHYSAEMAIQRGLSVWGPETPWLDFPCVAILLCPWTFLCHCSPAFLCIFLKQLNRNPVECRECHRKMHWRQGKYRIFSNYRLVWLEDIHLAVSQIASCRPQKRKILSETDCCTVLLEWRRDVLMVVSHILNSFWLLHKLEHKKYWSLSLNEEYRFMVLNVLCVRNFLLLKLMWPATGIRIIRLKYWYIRSLYFSIHLQLFLAFSPSNQGYMQKKRKPGNMFSE